MCWLPVASIRTLRRNPQYLTPQQMDSLKASISRDGFCAPILVRRVEAGTYDLVSGNHRYMAACELGYDSVPCVIGKMSEADAKRLAVNLNTIHGDPTAELLAPFLVDLSDEALAGVYVDNQLKRELLAFDASLSATLNKMALPEALSKDSPTSTVPHQCTCPDCGRVHARKDAAEDV